MAVIGHGFSDLWKELYLRLCLSFYIIEENSVQGGFYIWKKKAMLQS